MTMTSRREELSASPTTMAASLEEILLYPATELEGLDVLLEDLPAAAAPTTNDAVALAAAAAAAIATPHAQQQPEAEDDSDTPDSPDSVKSWRLSNAVQMELQDNAKVPSFLLPINRAGSSSIAHRNPATNNNTLESKRHYDYSYPEASSSSSPAKRQKQTDETANAFDPTPLSELQRRFRSVPLPIPTSATKQQQQQPPQLNSSAVGTAAATASVATSTTTSPPPKQQPPPPLPAHKKTPGVLTHATTQKQSSQYGFGRVPGSVKVGGTVADGREAAYERKKQRAKDARIRLNDSIDRLAIAMRVASQQAQQQLSANTTGNNSQQFSMGTQRALQSCVTIAERAKKFDRPSFVGTAADLVQGLTVQCEALAREVQQWRSVAQNTSTHGHPVVTSSAAAAAAPTVSTATGSVVDPSWIFRQQPKLLEAIQGYLDPLSLARSARVAKAWCRSLPEAWEQLALARFGVYNVRQWRDKQDASACSTRPLYATMAAASVVPRFGATTTITTHDWILLGHTSHPHIVHCWVYLRKRSNGETQRSILTATGAYACVPVVELRIVLQSTWGEGRLVLLRQTTGAVVVPNITIDASTRRRKETFTELTTDPRLRQRILYHSNNKTATDAAATDPSTEANSSLRLFDTVVLQVHVQCDGCATLAKCMQRSNYCLLTIGKETHGGGTSSLPLVVPFPRDVAYEETGVL